MQQPSEQVIRHLKITCTPEEYQAMFRRRRNLQGSTYLTLNIAEENYQRRLPRYLLARCPICGAAYVGIVDTHSLIPWRGVGAGSREGFFRDSKQLDKVEVKKRAERIEEGTVSHTDCRHFVGMQLFINLNGVEPTEKTYFSNRMSEIPFVMPLFLSYKYDFESYVVIHSLAICRIEERQFVPRYSLYVLTYYSTQPFTLWEWRRREQRKEGHFPPDMYTWSYVKDVPEAKDLPLWVRKGKLLWLDLEQDHLPLKGRAVEVFPYANIEGIPTPYIYRKGKFSIDNY